MRDTKDELQDRKLGIRGRRPRERSFCRRVKGICLRRVQGWNIQNSGYCVASTGAVKSKACVISAASAGTVKSKTCGSGRDECEDRMSETRDIAAASAGAVKSETCENTEMSDRIFSGSQRGSFGCRNAGKL